MKTTRVWLARSLALVACGALPMLVGIPGFESSAGQVWGRVRLNGRPLTGGVVVFLPVGGSLSQAVGGLIVRDGSYSIGSTWRRTGPGRARFKICVIPPGPRKVTTHWAPENEGRPPKAVPVSFVPESRVPHGDTHESVVPERVRDFSTTDLEVELGQEPARIDIDLRN